jgi:PAS domain S-box-containing protein
VRLVAVNNANREKLLRQGQLTKPLTRVQGVLFQRTDQNTDAMRSRSSYTAAIVDGDFTSSEAAGLRYRGRPIHVTTCASVEEAVATAERERLDFIIADKSLTGRVLQREGSAGSYTATSHVVFSKNVCMLVPAGSGILYGVVDRYAEAARTAGNRFSDSMVLVLIIFLAVFCAFLIYFLLTRSLYDELARNLEQLQESKSEMDATFNGVPVSMAEITPEGDVTRANSHLIQYVGVPATEMIGRNLGDIMALEMENQWKLTGVLKQVYESGYGRWINLRDKRRILEVRVYPIAAGKQERFLFMASDVTDVKMAEQQMLQHNKMIAVGQLASGVAHEIRNPLGLIRNYCYLLKTTDDEEVRRKAIEVIEQAVDKSGTIITNLLNFSRQSDAQPEEILIRRHIREVLSINEGMMKKKQIQVHFSESNDFKVLISVVSLDMVLINLLSNSCDAIESRGSITIRLYNFGEEFRIDFTDDGCGMEEDVVRNVYNPFFTTKQGQDGNGLGMYIVYNEVGKMNGSISLESQPGVGTTFRITLPVRGGMNDKETKDTGRG